MLKKQIATRKLVSFSGPCSVNCKHCYTHELSYGVSKPDSEEIDDLVTSLNDGQPFDVIYVSRSRENFINEDAGIELVQKLYSTYKKHILIITRRCLSDSCISRISDIDQRMRNEGQQLFVAVSIPANQSYSITEDKSRISTPTERCNCIRQLRLNGIRTILMARPIFPNAIIPVHEITSIIDEYAPFIDAVVSSGLAVNEAILTRLGMQASSLAFLPGDNAEFLIGSEAKNIRYVDVSIELGLIEECCIAHSIPFFSHSLDALNSLLSFQDETKEMPIPQHQTASFSNGVLGSLRSLMG